MGRITQTPVPDGSLLQALATDTGAYADCFEAKVTCDVPADDAFERFVFLFFDSPVFRLERAVLRLSGKAPKERNNPLALAQGDTDVFAVWRVHQRTETEILMAVPETPVRTWLSLEKDGGTAELRFGSAILSEEGKDVPHWIFPVTLRAHLVYSRLLLRAAVRDWTRGKALSG